MSGDDNCMTPEHCRDRQIECARTVREEMERTAVGVRAEIAALRSQTANDISAIRAAVQEIDRAVAKIKGFLGVNGDTPHLHGRKSDTDEAKPHMHRRERDEDWRVTVMWKAGIFLLTAMLSPVLFAAGTVLAKRLVAQ